LGAVKIVAQGGAQTYSATRTDPLPKLEVYLIKTRRGCEEIAKAGKLGGIWT